MIEWYNSLSKLEQYILLCLVMAFLHIIADYLVQNDFMANYKQKKNWEEYIKENDTYKYDYVVVLLVHGFSWAFITFFPILIIHSVWLFTIAVIVHTLIHAWIDNLKCNKFKINLILDQLYHLNQIFWTATIMIIIS